MTAAELTRTPHPKLMYYFIYRDSLIVVYWHVLHVLVMLTYFNAALASCRKFFVDTTLYT